MRRRQYRGVRAWYAGKNPPDEEVLSAVEEADGNSQVLYSHPAQEDDGEYVEIMKGLYSKMDSLKRSPLDFRTWTEQDGMDTFLEVLLDLAPADMRARVQILQKIGAFKFRAADSPDDKKAKVSAVFAESGEDDYKVGLNTQARKLALIWSPQEDSLLSYIISQPAQAGRVLSDRLSPANDTPLRLIGHPFTDVHSTVLQPLAEVETVAYERDSEIHLVLGVRPILENWDQDASVSGGCEQINLLETLLLHELVELYLDEAQPELDPLISHIIASTFERYLKGTLLNVAVEDFFLNWPPLSPAEMEERKTLELEQQLEEASGFLGYEPIPEDEDDDLDDLPMDPSGPASKKKVTKKKVVKKKTGTKKVVKKKKAPKKKP